MEMERDLQMAQKIARQVCDAGGRAYYVGGYVRDLLLGRQSKDIDLEIHGITPQTLTEILSRLGEPVAMGSSFGILGLRHYGLDISMPRKEEKGGRTGKDFFDGADPFVGTEKAARRRDLTVNALMQDVLTGQILDHFGGVEDLRKGILRHVDETSFREDPLRVLRVAQFSARFGFAPAEETVSLIAGLDISCLARERVWGELEKVLLKAGRPSVFFEVLRRAEQLDIWFPEIKGLIGVPQEKRYHPEGDVWNHTMLVLDAAAELRARASWPLGFMAAALCHDLGKTTATKEENGRIRSLGHEEEGLPLTGAFLGRLTKEAELHKYVLNMVQLHMRPNMMARQCSGDKAMCRLFDRCRAPEDLLLLAKADHCSRPGADPYAQTEEFLRTHLALYRERMARPGVMGADLIAAGFRPGPVFREALAYAHKLQLSGVEKEEALKQTLGYIKSAGTGQEK